MTVALEKQQQRHTIKATKSWRNHKFSEDHLKAIVRI